MDGGGSQIVNIAMVTPYFYPAWDYGGPPRSAYSLATALAGRGGALQVFTTDTGGARRLSRAEIRQASSEANRGLDVWYCRNLSNRLAFRHRLFLPAGLFRTLDRNLGDSELIHVHELRSFVTVAAARAARRNKIPYLISTHGGLMHLGKRRAKELFDSLWGNRIIRDAAGLLAVSTLEVNQMRSLGIRHDRIHVLPNPIEEAAYTTLPEPGTFKERWGIDSTSIVLFLGRLNWIKGADLLVKAVDRMSDDVHLVLAGPDDGHKPRLNALISNELAKRITFTGPLGHAEKLEAFVDADVCVVPSRSEIFGMVVLEALACRRPVLLSSSCGLNTELADQEGVLTFNNGDTHDLADKLKLMLARSYSTESLGNVRRFVLEKFSSEAVAAQAESIYAHCLSES
jgi:glycosyltransferase involved in cell wall biosynthesis